MKTEMIQNLISQAIHARDFSYCPYSGFAVGAALLTGNGKIFTGCNIENSAYSPGNCAERTAVFKAVSEGERKFCMLALVGGKKGEKLQKDVSPCGMCRQVLQEFCSADFPIIMAESTENYKIMTLGELLPLAFGADHL